jgi:hypothetical protein
MAKATAPPNPAAGDGELEGFSQLNQQRVAGQIGGHGDQCANCRAHGADGQFGPIEKFDL